MKFGHYGFVYTCFKHVSWVTGSQVDNWDFAVYTCACPASPDSFCSDFLTAYITYNKPPLFSYIYTK